MNETLVQKDLRFRYKSFLINANGLEVKQKSLLSSSEYVIAYENVGTRTYKSNKGTYGLLFSSTILCMVSILLYLLRNDGEGVESSVYFFYFGLSMILLILFLITYKRNFYLVKHGNVDAIEFFQNKPSKAEVNTFIDILKATRNIFLLNKYGQVNFGFTREENYRNLVWLANNEVINNVEFNIMVNKLNLEMQQQNLDKMNFYFSLN